MKLKTPEEQELWRLVAVAHGIQRADETVEAYRQRAPEVQWVDATLADLGKTRCRFSHDQHKWIYSTSELRCGIDGWYPANSAIRYHYAQVPQ